MRIFSFQSSGANHMSDESDIDESESHVSPQLPECKRLSFLNLCVVTVLVIFAIFTGGHFVLKSVRARQSREVKQHASLEMDKQLLRERMQETDLFAKRFLEVLLPKTLPDSLHKGIRSSGISGIGQSDQTRHAIMEFKLQLKPDDPNSIYYNSLRAEFDFVFKDGQWVLLEKPIFNPERFVDEGPRVFERKLLAENQDVRSLVAHFKAHKAEALQDTMMTFPMRPPVAQK